MSAVSTQKSFDFIGHEKSVSTQIQKMMNATQRIQDFNPKSKDVENYNEELRMLVANMEDGDNVSSQVKYVLEAMEHNSV